MKKVMTASEIRQSFLDYFAEQQHTIVPSAPLVPSSDATLLFTNAGMVQFKDVFLGTDIRPYKRAVDSQKCMRVAGKHNDLEDVGTDDTHHTFFEMLGNWSFGDYYKKEAIAWAWQLLTDVWGLPREKLYATCFKDEVGDIPTDEEAAKYWKEQPGMLPEHVLFFGRKDNFWEMAETGPSGPCSEIHLDRGQKYCNLAGMPGHQCAVNGDCNRFLELWNLVFIQYNRLNQKDLVLLPATHVDTGMGFERIVSILQDVDSNYKTDLFRPAMDTLRSLTHASNEEMLSNFTPYRVITDHCRAATFLMADGVLPGNTGRNYICRMIIRRAARFGSKIGLTEPFLAKVALAFINTYGPFYPEVEKRKKTILENLTLEETRFARTVETGTAVLENLLSELRKSGLDQVSGEKAFELYATYGLPFEITRDIAKENDLQVDEAGFRESMAKHRLASGGGKALGEMGGEDAEFYNQLKEKLMSSGDLGSEGVIYDPYQSLKTDGRIISLVSNLNLVHDVMTGEKVSVVMPSTGFYYASGGQVSDTGLIRSIQGNWEIEVMEVRKPSPGMIILEGEVLFGKPQVNDEAVAMVNSERRQDIMRNHTATHILHAELHSILGEHALQAGSLVAPDRLRFDFTHNSAVTQDQLEEIENGVNKSILADMPVSSNSMSKEKAIAEGATALFGEKYGESVRVITIIDPANLENSDKRYSYELCGGTHVDHTGMIGTFLITAEESAAAGIRRIEAITGREAYRVISARMKETTRLAKQMSTTPEDLENVIHKLMDEIGEKDHAIKKYRMSTIVNEFQKRMDEVETVNNSVVLVNLVENAEAETLRQLCDIFRNRFSNGIAVIGSVTGGKPLIIATVTEQLIHQGIKAGEVVKYAAEKLGGTGGGKPDIAQAGGKDPSKLPGALEAVKQFIFSKLDNLKK